jgi:hypothetical protein
MVSLSNHGAGTPLRAALRQAQGDIQRIPLFYTFFPSTILKKSSR